MLGIDDWLFKDAFLYQCDGACEYCSEDCKYNERINEERERDIKIYIERING